MTTKSGATIAALNDAFRTGTRPELGRVFLTAGAQEAVAARPLGAIVLHGLVKNFTAFTADNDPYGEHDFGSFEHVGLKFFWKIDYYDKASNLSAGAENPADDATCERVLTIMLAEEY